jgi:prophage antirepressor-like protein
MEQLKVFNHSDFGQIRVEIIDEQPWFVFKDLCNALGHSNNREAIQMLEEDEVRKVYLGVKTGTKKDGTAAIQRVQANVVSESGLYNMIFRSNLPIAKKFRKWVTNEVLPEIRKNGEYSLKTGGNKLRERANVDLMELLWTIDTYLNHGDKADIAL